MKRHLLLVLLFVAALVGLADARLAARNGGLTYYGHVFPVQGPTAAAVRSANSAPPQRL